MIPRTWDSDLHSQGILFSSTFDHDPVEIVSVLVVFVAPEVMAVTIEIEKRYLVSCLVVYIALQRIKKLVMLTSWISMADDNNT